MQTLEPVNCFGDINRVLTGAEGRCSDLHHKPPGFWPCAALLCDGNDNTYIVHCLLYLLLWAVGQCRLHGLHRFGKAGICLYGHFISINVASYLLILCYRCLFVSCPPGSCFRKSVKLCAVVCFFVWFVPLCIFISLCVLDPVLPLVIIMTICFCLPCLVLILSLVVSLCVQATATVPTKTTELWEAWFCCCLITCCWSCPSLF